MPLPPLDAWVDAAAALAVVGVALAVVEAFTVVTGEADNDR